MDRTLSDQHVMDPASPNPNATPPDADAPAAAAYSIADGDDHDADAAPAHREPAHDAPSRYPGAAPESTVWTGGPSQWTNFPVFIICALLSPLILPILYAAWILLDTRLATYTLTTERLRTERGVLNKQRDELELYRVRDLELKQSFWQRLVGIGTIVLLTSDRTHPTLTLSSVRAHKTAADLIRTHTEAMRRLKRVRDLDVD